jgi:hypothetical protein
MSEDKEQKTAPETPEVVFTEDCDLYFDALLNAAKELKEIEEKEKEFAYRKAILNDTITALKPMVFKRAWDINALNLSDAIRFIFKSTKRSLSALEVRSKLTDMGYSLDQFDNPLANIHTALTRMGETNELAKIEGEGKKKTFEPTPELKPIQEPEPSANALANLMALASLGTKVSENFNK